MVGRFEHTLQSISRKKDRIIEMQDTFLLSKWYSSRIPKSFHSKAPQTALTSGQGPPLQTYRQRFEIC